MFKFIFNILLFFIFSNLFSQRVILDSSYGINGLNKIKIEPNRQEYQNLSSVLLSDNSILFTGVTLINSINYPFVSKVKSNGEIDLSFGINGVAINKDIPNGFAQDIKIDKDNKILIGGGIDGANIFESEGIIIRYLMNGKIDSTFNLVGYKRYKLQKSFQGNSITINDNYYYLGGYFLNNGINADFAVLKLKSNGALDSTFGINGLGKVNIRGFDICRGVTILRNKRIILAGYNSTSNRAGIACLNENGKVDSTFGLNGILYDSISEYSALYQCKELENGKLICVGGGLKTISRVDYDFLVAKILPNGKLDKTFGNNGLRFIDTNLSDDFGSTIYELSSNRFLIAGTTDANYRLGACMIDSTGNLDTLFAQQGFFFTDIGHVNSYEYFNSITANKTEIFLSGFYGEDSSFYRPFIYKFKNTLSNSSVIQKEANKNSLLEIFPNPTTDFLKIKCKNSKKIVGIKIVDIEGKLVYEPREKLDNYFNGHIYEFNIKDKNIKGVYILKIELESDVYNGKIIIE